MDVISAKSNNIPFHPQFKTPKHKKNESSKKEKKSVIKKPKERKEKSVVDDTQASQKIKRGSNSKAKHNEPDPFFTKSGRKGNFHFQMQNLSSVRLKKKSEFSDYVTGLSLSNSVTLASKFAFHCFLVVCSAVTF